tara:strand:+ start:1385 stop:1789 length:405 start_codon:yes stop_codon:yes gene_type:complete
MVLYYGSGKNKTKNKKYKKKTSTKKNQKTKYLPNALGGVYPVISYEKYRAIQLVDTFNKPSDFKPGLMRKYMKTEIHKRLILVLTESRTAKNYFKKKYKIRSLTKKNIPTYVSKLRLKSLEKIYFHILKLNRSK